MDTNLYQNYFKEKFKIKVYKKILQRYFFFFIRKKVFEKCHDFYAKDKFLLKKKKKITCSKDFFIGRNSNVVKTSLEKK